MARYPDEITCDLAETYHVYDIRALSPETAAVLVFGLSPDSRTFRASSGLQVTRRDIFLAQILDGVRILIWQNSKDGRHGRNKPQSVFEALIGKQDKDKPVAFNSAEDFEVERRRILGEINGN